MAPGHHPACGLVDEEALGEEAGMDLECLWASSCWSRCREYEVALSQCR